MLRPSQSKDSGAKCQLSVPSSSGTVALSATFEGVFDEVWALIAVLVWVWYRVGRWHQRQTDESRRMSVARFALMAAVFILMVPVSFGYAFGRMVGKRASRGEVVPPNDWFDGSSDSENQNRLLPNGWLEDENDTRPERSGRKNEDE